MFGNTALRSVITGSERQRAKPVDVSSFHLRHRMPKLGLASCAKTRRRLDRNFGAAALSHIRGAHPAPSPERQFVRDAG
jgi:hypothetical protein